jgi:peptide/nickel transport system substrate-binding protein
MLTESPFAKVVKSRDTALLYGAFNLRKKESKWRDVRLRKAVNYAINRDELRKYAAKGNAYNLAGFIPTGEYGHHPGLDLYSYQTAEARALLTEAGYKNGLDVKMIVTEAFQLEAQIMSKMLERVGLRVQPDVLTVPEWFSKIYIPYLDKPAEEQDWDIGISYFADWFAHGGASFLPYSYVDEGEFRWIQYDSYCEEMWIEIKKTVGRNEQEDKIRQMQKYIYDQAYSLFIYSPLTLYAVNKEVKFVPQKSLWMRLKETSVTKNHWSLRGKNN